MCPYLATRIILQFCAQARGNVMRYSRRLGYGNHQVAGDQGDRGHPVTRLPHPRGVVLPLTRMLGSSRECLARSMASLVTEESPFDWISSTAICGRDQDGAGLAMQAAAGFRPGGISTLPPEHTSQRKRCPPRCHRPSLKSQQHPMESACPKTTMPLPPPKRSSLSPPYSGGKKCRFRGSSRSVRHGLWSSGGRAVGGKEGACSGGRLEQTPPSPSTAWARGCPAELASCIGGWQPRQSPEARRGLKGLTLTWEPAGALWATERGGKRQLQAASLTLCKNTMPDCGGERRRPLQRCGGFYPETAKERQLCHPSVCFSS